MLMDFEGEPLGLASVRGTASSISPLHLLLWPPHPSSSWIMGASRVPWASFVGERADPPPRDPNEEAGKARPSFTTAPREVGRGGEGAQLLRSPFKCY